MSHRRPLATAQLVVLVVGLAIALGVIGEYVTQLGNGLPRGWVAYAPLTNGPLQVVGIGIHPWARLLIWLALVAMWVLASLLIFHRGDSVRRGATSDRYLRQSWKTLVELGENASSVEVSRLLEALNVVITAYEAAGILNLDESVAWRHKIASASERHRSSK